MALQVAEFRSLKMCLFDSCCRWLIVKDSFVAYMKWVLFNCKCVCCINQFHRCYHYSGFWFSLAQTFMTPPPSPKVPFVSLSPVLCIVEHETDSEFAPAALLPRTDNERSLFLFWRLFGLPLSGCYYKNRKPKVLIPAESFSLTVGSSNENAGSILTVLYPNYR